MKISQNLSDLRALDHELYRHFLTKVSLYAWDDSFQTSLGGDVFIAESKEEAIGFLDAGYDYREFSPSANYVCIFQINNNSGGPTYVVPAEYFPEEQWEPDVDETNYDPYSGCDVYDRSEDIPF
jgi:hypothetical protein